MKKKIVVLSGAGISAESGIRTFRDSADGSYSFVGINTNFNYFTTAFDLKKQYVAVSQDNLYPK